MKAQQVIKEEIERVGRNSNLKRLQHFLKRVLEGLNDDVMISDRQRLFIISQISWYGTPGRPRVEPIGTGVPGEAATRDAYEKWLICPTTVNSFVTTINGMRAA